MSTVPDFTMQFVQRDNYRTGEPQRALHLAHTGRSVPTGITYRFAPGMDLRDRLVRISTGDVPSDRHILVWDTYTLPGDVQRWAAAGKPVVSGENSTRPPTEMEEFLVGLVLGVYVRAIKPLRPRIEDNKE